MIVVGPSVVLDAQQCAALARLAGDGVRRARARGEVVSAADLAVVDEIAAVARAARAASEPGSAELPQHDTDEDHDDDGLSTADAATRLGITDRRVRQLIDQGRLSARKRHGAWNVPTDEVERIIARRTEAQLPGPRRH